MRNMVQISIMYTSHEELIKLLQLLEKELGDEIEGSIGTRDNVAKYHFQLVPDKQAKKAKRR